MALSLDDQRYYEEILATLKSPGWRYLLEDFNRQRAAYDSVAAVSTLEQLWLNKGRVDNLDYLANLLATFERTYTELSSD